MPRSKIPMTALAAPPTAMGLLEGLPDEAREQLVLDTWKESLFASTAAALESKSLSAYKATYKDYLHYCTLHGYKGKACMVSIGTFLQAKCEAVKNAASFSGWASHIVHCARQEKNLHPITTEDRFFLRMLKRACGKLYGERHSQAPEWGADEMATIWERVRPDPAKNLKEYAFFVQALVSTVTLARPEDFAGPQCVVRAKHVTFLPATQQLPFGGFAIQLDNSKKQRRTGRKGEERLLGYGTGTPACPVMHLKKHLTIYDLRDHPEQFLFARLRSDGTRALSPSTGETSVVSQAQYNSALGRLSAKAGIKRVTARGSRAGGRTDLGAAGVSDSVATTLGRWNTQQSGRPYSRQAVSLLNHVVKVLGITAPAQHQAAIPAAPREKRVRQAELAAQEVPAAAKKRRV
jgi:hypothetical protein